MSLQWNERILLRRFSHHERAPLRVPNRLDRGRRCAPARPAPGQIRGFACAFRLETRPTRFTGRTLTVSWILQPANYCEDMISTHNDRKARISPRGEPVVSFFALCRIIQINCLHPGIEFDRACALLFERVAAGFLHAAERRLEREAS